MVYRFRVDFRPISPRPVCCNLLAGKSVVLQFSFFAKRAFHGFSNSLSWISTIALILAFILFKQKKTDIRLLAETINLTDALIRYIEKPKAKGTGLIVAGQTTVPFENPIPKHTELFRLVATDAYRTVESQAK